MIQIVVTDIFKLQKQQGGVEALVNPVNLLGKEGKGLAKEFQKRFSANSYNYRKACDRGPSAIAIGKNFVFHNAMVVTETRPLWIINVATKNHWKDDSTPAYLDAGLKDLRKNITEHNIDSIIVPALGCGNGNLNFDNDFLPLARLHLGNLPDTKVWLVRPV